MQYQTEVTALICQERIYTSLYILIMACVYVDPVHVHLQSASNSQVVLFMRDEPEFLRSFMLESHNRTLPAISMHNFAP